MVSSSIFTFILCSLTKGATDWEWWIDSVPDKLRELHKDGYRVLFFTNQAGIEKLKVKPEELQKKIEAIIKELGIPVMVNINETVILFHFLLIKTSLLLKSSYFSPKPQAY